MTNYRIAINGFGRIGRIFMRRILEKEHIEVVAVNDLTDVQTLAHLFKYDSVHGRFDGTVSATDDSLTIGGNHIHVLKQTDPSKLPWKDYKIDLVLESTGHFLKREMAEMHLGAGASRVLLSAPPKSSDIKTIVIGVNDNTITAEDRILSNASCTTNCALPMIKVLHDHFSIGQAFVSTIHAYTADQRLQDAPHHDLRRARAAAANIIPTTTGAAKAITMALPALEGKITGSAVRVPVSDGSLTEIVARLEKDFSVQKVNDTFRNAAEGPLRGILSYTEDPIVSTDIVGDSHSCIFDASLSAELGNMIKIVGWYDNEFGYSSRLADLVVKISSL